MTMKLCPNCRTQNDDDAKFCKECATPFTTEISKSNSSPQTSNNNLNEPAASNRTLAHEENKHQAPLDYYFDKEKNKFNKSSATSENQPSFWQKAKDIIKENYYVMFFLVMIALVFVVLIIGVNSSNRELKSTSSSSTDSLSSELARKPIIKVSESDIIEIDYNYLAENYERFKDFDKYFKIAGKITRASSYNSHSLSFKTDDGNEVSVDFQSGCIIAYYKVDTYVTLVGKYYTGGYSFLSLSDAYIVESGEEAEQTYKRLKDKWDKQRAADKKAEKEKAKKAKKDYIASCKTYKYKDIARNPDKYEGKKARFKGKVVQVVDDYFETILRVNVTKGKYGIYTNTIYVVYTPKSESESRILEDDIITIYGELNGIETYDTVMGSKVSIPRIDAEYITINSK